MKVFAGKICLGYQILSNNRHVRKESKASINKQGTLTVLVLYRLY
jgi:hypothetical protein